MKSKVLTLSCLLSFLFIGLQAQEKNPNTDWFMKSKYGLFFHFLPSGKDFQKAVDKFDVEALAQDCSDVGAGYVFITLGQNSGYYISPNSVFDRYAGVKPGERCSKRDLPAELAKALKKKGIKLMLYIPGDAPAEDSIIAKRLGAKEFVKNQNGENWVYNELLIKRWAEVAQEWSDKYGSLVSGWWVDGCYVESGFTNEFGHTLIKALKHGNPNSIVALNSGTNYNKLCDIQDYLAGEENNVLGANCTSRFKDGAQWHELSFLGRGWGSGKPSCTAQQLINYLQNNIIANGGVLTLDLPFDTGSRIHPLHLTLLREVKAAIRK